MAATQTLILQNLQTQINVLRSENAALKVEVRTLKDEVITLKKEIRESRAQEAFHRDKLVQYSTQLYQMKQSNRAQEGHLKQLYTAVYGRSEDENAASGATSGDTASSGDGNIAPENKPAANEPHLTGAAINKKPPRPHSRLRASAPAWFPPSEPTTSAPAPTDASNTPAPAVEQATTAPDNLAAVAGGPPTPPPVEERVWRFRSASDLCAFSAPPSPPAEEEEMWKFAGRVWRRVVGEDGGVAWRL